MIHHTHLEGELLAKRYWKIMLIRLHISCYLFEVLVDSMHLFDVLVIRYYSTSYRERIFKSRFQSKPINFPEAPLHLGARLKHFHTMFSSNPLEIRVDLT